MSIQDMTRILNDIRLSKGYERFMLSLKYDELSVVCKDGPAVIINLSMWRSDALLLTLSSLDRPQLIPLAQQTLHLVQRWSEELRRGTADMANGLANESDVNRRVLKPILRGLWELIVRPITEGLRSLAPYARRIWWCPTSPLASLPLHIASDGDMEPPYISSYITAITSLLRAQSSNNDDVSLKVLAVGCSDVANHSPLPGIMKEMEILKDCLRGETLNQLVDNKATVEEVKQQLATHSWVHLSCHGYPASSNDAYRSYFVLTNGNLYMSDIIQQQQNAPNARFAFLSACHTATGVSKLGDEAMHLAASMSFLGFRGVIATLWSVRDNITPLIVESVYQYLFQTPEQLTNAMDSSEALHKAVQSPRKGNRNGMRTSMLSLAPFVHMGVRLIF